MADEPSGELSWYVRIDSLRFKQVIINILSNSIKFTPTGGGISLCIKEVERRGNISSNTITISDTGIGMSEAFLANKLYKPFSQEENVVSGKYGGTGLGLSIVKKLVDLMGGRIEVSSKLGEGTTFVIYLDIEVVPADEVKHLREAQHSAEEENKHSLAGKRILLCEDHPLNAEITMRLLHTQSCHVDWAKDGQIGVNMFAESTPGYYDAILMDIRMPIMDGIEATKTIRHCGHTDAQTIPIIAMSANAYKEDIRQSIEAGMNDHMAKPVSPQSLFDTLAKYLEKA